MSKKILWIILVISLFMPVSLFSQNITNSKIKIRPRWEIAFSSVPPKMFTYTAPRSDKENYWYLIYTVKNKSNDSIRLGVDVCIKAVIEENKPDKDIYYQDAIHPIIEDQIIVYEERLMGLNQGLQKERIIQLKKELKYLNCKELRDKKEIKPDETIKALAIFNEINPKSVRLELMVGGLTDVIKWRYESPPSPTSTSIEDKIIYEYECKIKKIIYDCRGDEFWDQTKPLKQIKQEWLVRDYGPLGNKTGLESMLQSLADPNPLLRWTGWYLLYTLTGLEFSYNPKNPPEENTKPIQRWQEWWYRNKEYLTYNSTLNKFEINNPKK